MLRRQHLGGNGEEQISIAEVPDEGRHYESLVFMILEICGTL